MAATPDRLVVWAAPAILWGLRAALRSDVIYAYGPPYTNYLVANGLARITGKPVVAMVDDPWGSMDHREWRSSVQKRMNVWQERFIMRHAAAILTATHGFRADIARRLGPEIGAKTHVIYWGFDPDDYPLSTERNDEAQSRPFELLYTGSLRGEQYDVSVLLSVLHQWLERSPDLSDRFRLRLVGGVDDRYRKMIADLQLQKIISVEGFAPHRELAAVAASADALLLVINDSREIFRSYTSAKLFHYMGLRRPVLALVPPDGEAAAVVREKRLGLVAKPSDPVAVREALERLVTDREKLLAGAESCEEYTSGCLIARAAAVFDAVTERR